jgi:hypothetical protein
MSLLVDAFLAERPGWASAQETLGPILETHLAAGKAAWPDAPVSPAAFARQLALACADEADPE